MGSGLHNESTGSRSEWSGQMDLVRESARGCRLEVAAVEQRKECVLQCHGEILRRGLSDSRGQEWGFVRVLSACCFKKLGCVKVKPYSSLGALSVRSKILSL